ASHMARFRLAARHRALRDPWHRVAADKAATRVAAAMAMARAAPRSPPAVATTTKAAVARLIPGTPAAAIPAGMAAVRHRASGMLPKITVARATAIIISS